MFTRAVQGHDSSRPSFNAPSSSPSKTLKNATQVSIQTAFSAQKPAILKPAQGSLHGITSIPSGSTQTPDNTMSDSRKRSFSQHNGRGLATVFDPNSAFRENFPPQTVDDPPQSGVSALHDAVYFDDADFSDDSDLDFDISAPTVYPSLSRAAAALPSEQQQQQQQQQPSSAERMPAPRPRQSIDTYEDLEFPPHPPCRDLRDQLEPPSSAPVPWSSSPVEHLQPSRRQPILDPQDNGGASPPPKKRRTLPWKTKQENAGAVCGAPHSRAVPRNSRPVEDDPMPWNGDFKSIEAGKKEARKRSTAKQQKRTMSTATSDPEEVRRVRKGQEPVARIFLSEEQKKVVDLVTCSKQSVFFTGSAGTGKSVLLRELISVLKKEHRKDSDAVAVTASTGLAACNIGGVTLHSFAGIGLGKEPVPDLVKKIKKNQKAKTRWIRSKILIMDEISMVDGDLFDKLEAIARQIRNNGRAFGGIQLLITGDFFQLPPVPEGGRQAKFAFDANTWNTCITHTIGLTQVFRQRDPEFAGMLNEMRLGTLSSKTIQTFHQLNRAVEFDDGIQATQLFSTRTEVDNANHMKMLHLPGEARRFKAADSGSIKDEAHRTKLLSSCMAPAVIDLKIHSQVMLIKNINDSLVNGSLGRVVGFMSEKMFDLMGEQGISDTENSSTTHDTLPRWPLVQFAMLDGTSQQLLCQPEMWKVELPNGEVQASRSQVPLILAWALSIHKAQGQTLERVKVDLRRVFEKGQAYVALSRATCKEGLQVLGFDDKRVMAHKKVREFYNSLYSATEAAKKAESVKEAAKKPEARAIAPRATKPIVTTTTTTNTATAKNAKLAAPPRAPSEKINQFGTYDGLRMGDKEGQTRAFS